MADTATSSKSLSTAKVNPQDRGFNSDREEMVVLSFNGDATGGLGWSPRRKVQITALTMVNGGVAQAAATNTTALDVDVVAADGTTKSHDVAAKAAGTAVAIYVASELTLSTTVADLIIEATETLKAAVAIVGTQGEFVLQVHYVPLEVSDLATDWTV